MRRLRRLLLALCLTSGIVLLAALLVLRSRWLAGQLRQTLVSNLQQATGARVDLGAFQWNWRTLTVELHDLTLHGVEPSTAPPLFYAPLIRARLRILSALRKQIEIQTLLIDQPRLAVTVDPDGHTNLPTPRLAQPTGFTVRLPYLELRHGLATLNDRRLPLDLTGQNLDAELRNQTRLALRIARIHLNWTRGRHFDTSLSAAAVLQPDGLTLTSAHLQSATANLSLSGALHHFAAPTFDYRLRLTTSADEAMRTLGIKEVHQGFITVDGAGHREGFAGTLVAHGLNADLLRVHLHNGQVRSTVRADSAGISLPDLTVHTAELTFSGAAAFPGFRQFRLSGSASALSLQTVAQQAIHRPSPYAATAAGPLQISATVWPEPGNLVVHGDLRLAPASHGIPVSGDVHLTYRQNEGSLEFQPSTAALPHSQLEFSGNPIRKLYFALDSSDPGHDFQPILPPSPVTFSVNTHAKVVGLFDQARPVPQLNADLHLVRFEISAQPVESLAASLQADPTEVRFQGLALESPIIRARASGSLSLTRWSPTAESTLHLAAVFSHAQLAALARNPNLTGGLASGTLQFDGTQTAPSGTAHLSLADLTIRHQHLDSAHATVAFSGQQLQVSDGNLQSGRATAAFSGAYRHDPSTWNSGILQLTADTNAFPLAVAKLTGEAELHVKTTLGIAPSHLTPMALTGHLSLRSLLVDGVPAGALQAVATTQSEHIHAQLTGNFRGTPITGITDLQIAPGTPATGELHFAHLSLETLAALVHPNAPTASPLTGTASADLTFDGPLESPGALHAVVRVPELALQTPAVLRAPIPALIEVDHGQATIRSFALTGQDTRLDLSGTASASALNLKAVGAIDLRLLQIVFPTYRIGGSARLSASLNGTLADPKLAGSLELAHGSAVAPDLPNALTDLHGTILFDGNRATLQNVVAHTGGGTVAFRGFVTYSASHPLVYRLEASGQNVRLRYANGVSVTANSELSLTGTSNQSLLSGGLTVSRIVFNPSTDVGNLLALSAVPVATPDSQQPALLSQVQLDLHLQSAPDLQLDTALSSGVQAEINLQLRGTPQQPILLGTLSANEGDIKVFGGRYSINRGEISFTNPARIEPILDLDLETQARGITVDITLSGTLNKLNINYRSDPPLQPRDIIALLTVGRTPDSATNTPNIQTNNDGGALQSGANTVLGQAISPVSNRLSKLFGITNIKIDPLVQGITNTPQARLTLEQQVSRQITVTYITNLSQTSEQIFRLEYALNRQFSLVALRDDNGEFGIDILYKKRFK